MKKITKKVSPSVASKKQVRRPFFVPMISVISIVFAFVAVLFAFNTMSASYVQQKTNNDVAQLQSDVAALRARLDQRAAAPSGNVVARPVEAVPAAMVR